MAQLRPARIQKTVQPTAPDMGPSHNLGMPLAHSSAEVIISTIGMPWCRDYSYFIDREAEGQDRKRSEETLLPKYVLHLPV